MDGDFNGSPWASLKSLCQDDEPKFQLPVGVRRGLGKSRGSVGAAPMYSRMNSAPRMRTTQRQPVVMEVSTVAKAKNKTESN